MGRRKRSKYANIGTVLLDRYELVAELGEGGMAEVFRAHDHHKNRQVAIKVLRHDISARKEAILRTQREGEVLSELSHPTIVDVESWEELDDGTIIIIMELLRGETLGDRMRGGALSPEDLLPIIAGTCAGLHAAHERRIIHRDLKPDNIFLVALPDGTEQIKLLDFGIAKITGLEKLTRTGEILGTPRYMSPEQLGAERDVDARADTYSLGVILYEALADQPPYMASNPMDLIIAILNGQCAPLRSLRPSLPTAVESVVMRAMSHVRTARYDTAADLANAFIHAVHAHPESKPRARQRTKAYGEQLHSALQEAIPPTNPSETENPNSLAGKLQIGTFSEANSADTPDDKDLPFRPTDPSNSPDAHTNHTRDVKSAGRTPATRASPAFTGIHNGEHASSPTPSSLGHASAEQPSPAQSSPVQSSPAQSSPTPPHPRSVGPTAAMPAHADPRLLQHTPASTLTPGAHASGSLRTPETPTASSSFPTGILIAALIGGILAAGIGLAGAWALWHINDNAEGDMAATAENDTAESNPSVPPNPTVEASVPGSVTATPEETPAPEGIPSDVAPTGTATATTADRPNGRSSTQQSASETLPVPRRVNSRTRPRRTKIARNNRRDDTASNDTSERLSPFEILRSARSQLPQECVNNLTRLMETAGPSSQLLLQRGDCYADLGNRSAAMRDYRRFCQVASDNPAIGRVRQRMQSWGASCP